MPSELNKILYVEDEKDIQAIAQVALETVGGFTVKICSNGNEAINSISEFSPDLLLLDVMMPNMDGISVCKSLRSKPETEKLPIIMLSGKTHLNADDALLAESAIAVIPKPFDPMELANKIKEIWKKA